MSWRSAEPTVASFTPLRTSKSEEPLKLGVTDLRKTTFAQIGMCEKWNLLGAPAIDRAAAGLFFRICVCVFTPDFSFPIAIFIFAIATLAGLLSLLSAGVGSFDLTVIALCAKLGLSTSQVLLGLVLHRIFYYIVPRLLTTAVWVADSAKELESDFPYRVMARVLALVTAFSSLLFFIPALTPEIASCIQIVQEVLPSTVWKASYLTVLLTAIMLLILAHGINQRVRCCYQLVLVLLGVAAVICSARGIDYEEAVYLGVFALALFASRSAFDRDPLPLKWSSSVLTAAPATVIPIVLSSWHALRVNKVVNVPAPSHHANIHWPVILSHVMPACVVAIAVLFSCYCAPEFEEPCEEQTRRFEKLIVEWGGNAFPHLYYLGDKQVFSTADKRNGTDRATLLYCLQGTTLIALGDPFGDPDFFNQSFADFIDYADASQCFVAFYEVGEEYLARCANEGMSLAKLGEDAAVDISGFTRVGSKGKTSRRMHNKSESSVCIFEIVEAPHNPDLITELRDASQAWLGKRTEISFSLGFFDEDHLSRAPIAIVRSADPDRTERFTSPIPQGLNVASVDLMRIRPDAPDGVIDGTFVSLMEWAKNHGYIEFNSGMAPMSNIGARPHSGLSEKTVYLVYNYDGRIYNFRGLCNYKEKFKSVWKSRYLTYTDVKSLPAITAGLSKLINRLGQYSATALPASEDEMPTPEMVINASWYESMHRFRCCTP